MERIEAALDECGMFVSIGTSGQVYPAAGFVRAVRARARCVELNLEETDGTALFHEAHHGPATEIVPAFVERMLASCG
jgi:NAD-dependent deacetylase